jgi:hypothetical protein
MGPGLHSLGPHHLLSSPLQPPPPSIHPAHPHPHPHPHPCAGAPPTLQGVQSMTSLPLGDPSSPDLLAHPAVLELAAETGRSPAQVLLKWNVQRGVVSLAQAGSLEEVAERFGGGLFAWRLTWDQKVRGVVSCLCLAHLHGVWVCVGCRGVRRGVGVIFACGRAGGRVGIRSDASYCVWGSNLSIPIEARHHTLSALTLDN